jgi:hypothetical protein
LRELSKERKRGEENLEKKEKKGVPLLRRLELEEVLW